ncbi:hypothetical protein C8J57DRAFT_1246702 [Mycena rebaudengoi]|nr:hypothetical protein C8J57DRAFT_1246702 [Mycena rebaudengoi]
MSEEKIVHSNGYGPSLDRTGDRRTSSTEERWPQLKAGAHHCALGGKNAVLERHNPTPNRTGDLQKCTARQLHIESLRNPVSADNSSYMQDQRSASTSCQQTSEKNVSHSDAVLSARPRVLERVLVLHSDRQLPESDLRDLPPRHRCSNLQLSSQCEPHAKFLAHWFTESPQVGAFFSRFFLYRRGPLAVTADPIKAPVGGHFLAIVRDVPPWTRFDASFLFHSIYYPLCILSAFYPCLNVPILNFVTGNPPTTSSQPSSEPPQAIPATSRNQKAQKTQKVRWAPYTAETASRKIKPAATPRSIATDISLGKLNISAAQRQLIDELYIPSVTPAPTTLSFVDHLFTLDDNDQISASAIMAQHGLDLDARAALANQWSQQWSCHSGKNDSTRKILYLCHCGYDHTLQSKERHTPLPFTGCLSHTEITYVVSSEKILRIRGYFEHNQACKNAVYSRIPPVPVHPSVYVVALAQLRDGATFADVKKKNRQMVASRSYQDFPADLHDSPYRWLLKTEDSRSLHRQYSRMNGVKVTEKPQVNVDEWLNPQSPEYNPAIAEAVFHYSARAEKGNRFEACIATEDMKAAAWKYGHNKQIILDGTSGVCDSRLLVFIVMVVDENKKGIPVAFLLFSAPTGNKQSSAGYNTTIIAKLLAAWRDSLTKCGSRYGFAGVVFGPLTAITDTDMKERGALIIVFTTIWLLICRFHLRQSWKNHRNKLLKGIDPLKIDLKNCLKRLEDSLVATQTIAEARALLAAEKELLLRLEDAKAARKAVKHLDYLSNYWTTDNLWQSWSDYGRKVAAALLGCHMDGVIPTTNHLESFNGILKRKHLRRWQNGGRRLRVDVLIQILIIHILPSIFQERRLYLEQDLRIAAQVRQLPGGQSLLQNRAAGKQNTTVPKVAYLIPDQGRDERANLIIDHRQIGAPILLPDNSGFIFTCYSSEALEVDTNPVQYTINVLFNGVVKCTCPDFSNHGGACKHIRAAFLILELFRQQGTRLPEIPIPTSVADAHILEANSCGDVPLPASQDLPTARAAAAIADVLAADESHDSDEEDVAADYDGSDAESIASNESSDSDSDDAPLIPSPSMNRMALGEQALSRTVYELEESASKFGDLAEFLKNHEESLSDGDLHDRLLRACGPAAALVAEVFRICGNPPHTLPAASQRLPPSTMPTSTQITSTAGPGSSQHRKRIDLLPPSPEKASKRQTSFAPHKNFYFIFF